MEIIHITNRRKNQQNLAKVVDNFAKGQWLKAGKSTLLLFADLIAVKFLIFSSRFPSG